MKLSVSLSANDVAQLDDYARAAGLFLSMCTC